MNKSVRMLATVALTLAAISTPAWAAPVPEIDPGSMSAALTLLSGAALILGSRKRSK